MTFIHIREALENDVLSYCDNIIKKVLASHPNIKKKKIKIKDWPAAVSSCCFEGREIYHDISKVPTNVKFDKRIYKQFNNLGGIKEGHVKGCNNQLGRCAEQRAANKLLKENHQKFKRRNIKDINFSTAYRPRTMGVVPMCENCKFIFKN